MRSCFAPCHFRKRTESLFCGQLRPIAQTDVTRQTPEAVLTSLQKGMLSLSTPAVFVLSSEESSTKMEPMPKEPKNYKANSSAMESWEQSGSSRSLADGSRLKRMKRDP